MPIRPLNNADPSSALFSLNVNPSSLNGNVKTDPLAYYADQFLLMPIRLCGSSPLMSIRLR